MSLECFTASRLSDAATTDGSAAGVLPSLLAVCDTVSRATKPTGD